MCNHCGNEIRLSSRGAVRMAMIVALGVGVSMAMGLLFQTTILAVCVAVATVAIAWQTAEFQLAKDRTPPEWTGCCGW